MSDLGTPHVPPVDWSQVPAELWPLPVAEPVQPETSDLENAIYADLTAGLQSRLRAAEREFLGDLDSFAPTGILTALDPSADD